VVTRRSIHKFTFEAKLRLRGLVGHGFHGRVHLVRYEHVDLMRQRILLLTAVLGFAAFLCKACSIELNLVDGPPGLGSCGDRSGSLHLGVSMFGGGETLSERESLGVVDVLQLRPTT
jgi:hypothetical protein